MPFTYRDKPKLADRLRGKSGEEILNELKSGLDPERRMFFESPSWRTRQNSSGFPRGFPFDDEQNRTNIRTYLDEIASRHPEFADQLKEPAWGGDFTNPGFGRKRRGSNSGREELAPDEPSGSSRESAEVKEPRQNLTNFGLRNTVPLGPGAAAEEERRQRSMSAPPDNRASGQPKRFVTTCEIPVMNDQQETGPPKPDVGPKGAQEQNQQKPNNAPNVRLIPIQVEGREAPIVNANIDTATNFGSETFRDGSFEARLPRDFGNYQRQSPRFAHKERAPTPPQYHQYAPQFQQYGPPPQQNYAPQQQHFAPQQQQPQYAPQHFAQPPQQQPFAQQQQQQQRQHSPKPSAPPPQQPPHHPQASKLPRADEVDSKPPPAPPKPEPPKDPIEKVQAIQKEVEELMRQVEAFSGNSRTDKQYLMLDELLTRQLLLLDSIDSEGKDNVKQARKDAIRSIQRCISTLENKVPVPESNEPSAEGNKGQDESKTEGGGQHAMEVDQTNENSSAESKEIQSMEVDSKSSKEQQQQQQQPQQQQVASQEQQKPEENK